MAAHELLNIRAEPHIQVVCHPTSNTSRWSRNDFIDPVDGAPWDEQDLTPIERGHVYLWKEDNEAWVHIYMPFRIMDAETATLLKGCKTYRSTPPFVTGKQYALDKLARNPKSCLHTFKFTREFLTTFRSRIASLGGLLEKDEVDVTSLIGGIQEARATVQETSNGIALLREKYCSASGDPVDSNEKLQEALTAFSNSRERLVSIGEERVILGKMLGRLKLEAGRKTAYIEANEWFTTLTTEMDTLRRTDFDRLEREAIHKHRRDSGEIATTARPSTLMALGTELQNLKQYYPSLQKLTAVSDQIWLELPGIKIQLLPDGSVTVVGDPAALKPFIDGSTSVKAQGRRRRAIYTKGDE